MVFVKNWEDFEIAAENMYMKNPKNCRFTVKYVHKKGNTVLKMTDNEKCVQYKTEILPDVKKMERFTSNLMWQMASKE